MSKQQAYSELRFKAKWLKRKLELLNDTPRDIEMMLFQEIDKIINSKEGQPIVQRSSVQLTRVDFDTLDWNASGQSAWLTDKIVNHYMELINKRSQQNKELLKVYGFSSFLIESFKVHGYNYERVEGWTTRAKVDLFQMDKIFIPVNEEDHWTLVIIHNDRKRIGWYNSLSNTSNTEQPEFLHWVKRYLYDECQEKRGYTMDQTDWDFENTTEPRQGNLSDCGIFVCTYADLMATNWPMFFQQEHMKMIRRKMMGELLSGQMYLTKYRNNTPKPVFEVYYNAETNITCVIHLAEN